MFCSRWEFALTGLLMGLGATAAVVADPPVVTVTAPDQEVTVRLTEDGKPLPASSIRGWKLWVDKHDYDEMFSSKVSDGALTLRPTEYVEVGSYDLIIDTTSGPVKLKLYTPLSEQLDIIEQKAREWGVSEDEARIRLGLVTGGLRESLELNIAPIHYPAQSLNLELPLAAGRTGTWLMNGDPVPTIQGKNAIDYTFERPGQYVLSYTEKDERGQTIAAASARTTVVEQAPVRWEVPVNTTANWQGPAGYREYVWLLDGNVISNQSVLQHTFTSTGTHLLECIARNPEGAEPASTQVKYRVTVVSQLADTN